MTAPLFDHELERQYVSALLQIGGKGHVLGESRVTAADLTLPALGQIVDAAHRVTLAEQTTEYLPMRAELEHRQAGGRFGQAQQQFTVAVGTTTTVFNFEISPGATGSIRSVPVAKVVLPETTETAARPEALPGGTT